MSRLAQVLAISALCAIAGAAPQQRPNPPKRTPAAEDAPSPAPKSSRSDTPAPAPITMSDADGQELILEEMSARTAIEGMLSLTELDLRFRNPKSKRVEGRFSCTLPANAAISRFAKEVNGQLMEGEVVERLRANQVYEQFLHQMRDPALLEQDQGNRFSARIFPIEANATTRLVLSYSAVLPMEGGVRRYALPLRGMPSMKHFTFRAFVSALPGEEGPGAATSNVAGLSGATHSTADVISIDENDYTPAHDIDLTWHPTANASRLRVLKAGDFYVAAFRPDIAPTTPHPTPHAWTFYIDTSASSAEGSEHRIHALETLLASLPPGDDVQLLAFDQEIVPLGAGTADELSRSAGSLLRARLFLGGTDLSSLFHRIAKEGNANRAVVIASDLVATLGDVDPHALNDAIKSIPPGVTVHALILGSRQDSATAKALTAGRGRVVSIPFSESLDDRARDAAVALRRPLGASFDLADRGAQWIYPTHPDDVQSGDEVITFGRIKPGAEPAPAMGAVTLDDRSLQTLAAGTFGPLLEREAYRAYLAYLAEREANEPSEAVRSALVTEQIKVSVERRVVIPRTTMLVLETEWDYQRFGLERRALASILTIDAGGIGVMDRHNASWNPPTPQPPPVRMSKTVSPATVPAPVVSQESIRADDATRAAKDQVEGGVEGGVPGGVAGGVVGGVAGGVVGGVVGGVLSDTSAQRVAAFAATSPSPDDAPRGDAPALQEGRAGNGVPPPPSPVPPPPREAILVQPAPPAPPGSGRESRLARRHRAPRSNENQGVDWVKAAVPGEGTVNELFERLDANPSNRESYNILSDALVAREDWERLRRLALHWQPYDPENPQVYEVLGIADEHLGKTTEAARADASLIEIAPGKTELLQRAGLLLLRTHHANLAEAPLRRALELRPDRVNSYRHLALLLWQDGRVDEAARVLESATRQQFPVWYGSVQRVLREELGYLYRAIGRKEPARRAEIEARAREYDVDLDRRDALRITLAWETDANDVDLHVVDPDGEECFYQHKKNDSGLELYEDITQGLGPEVIRTEELQQGTYHVGVNYFSAGPMGVSRGIVVILRGDDVQIVPFRLVDGSNQAMRHLAAITVK